MLWPLWGRATTAGATGLSWHANMPPTYHTHPLPQVLGVKKVALLFVTGAHMPHDALWRLWLESAAGLLPQQAVPSLLDAACGPVLEKWLLLLCACYPKRVSGPVAAVQPPWQYLYSLYVHSPPWNTDGYQGGRQWWWIVVCCGGGTTPEGTGWHACARGCMVCWAVSRLALGTRSHAPSPHALPCLSGRSPAGRLLLGNKLQHRCPH